MARRRDDDEDEDERPRAKRRRDEDDEDEDPRPKKKPRPADDDEEDERPRKKARRDDDEDDDDDRPKKRYAKPKGMSKGLLVGLIGVGLAVIVGGIVLVIMLGGGSSPKSAFEKMVKAAQAKDYGTFYDGMDKKSQELATGPMALGAAFLPKLKGKTGRDLYIAAITLANEGKPGGADAMPGYVSVKTTVISEKVTGDRATLVVKDDKVQEAYLTMVKEDGKWKLSLIDRLGGMPDFKIPDFKIPDFKMPDGKEFPKFEFPK